jgi:hypothetical protein
MSKVFISYSHNDRKWEQRVVKHLGVLEQEKKLSVWDDRKISGGDDWLPEIEKAIQECEVALLLISADFLNSGFILGQEVPRLLKRRASEGLRVIPIILWPCPWTQVTWLHGIQARPTDGKPLSSLTRPKAETALSALAEEVLQISVSITPLSVHQEAISNSLTLVPALDVSSGLNKEIINDMKVISKIFQEITSLRELDYFIDQALYPYLIHSVLAQHDYLERYINSSFYHVFDDKLRDLIHNFYISWSEACQYWQAFTPTNVPDKLRPNTWLDLARTEDVATAIQKVPEAAKVMHRSLQELLRYVRNTFRQLDL